MTVTMTTMTGQDVYGLWGESGDRTVAKDIAALSERYHSAVGKARDTVLPFFVLSKDYDKSSGRFRLFIGGTIPHERLEAFRIPEGVYARMTVRPKLGFLWGLAVGEAKRYFYMRWLPSSRYGALNMEYEYHTEKSLGKRPEIELYFAVKER